MSPSGHATFPGGFTAKSLFEESRYCFVYGQFLATIVVGLSYIERTLAAEFYALGRDDLERANISKLLQEALEYDMLTQIEVDNLNKIRKIRNLVSHFRRPGTEESIEYRSIIQSELPYEVIEQDARHVMEVVFRILQKNTF
jgi:hypothetical protein